MDTPSDGGVRQRALWVTAGKAGHQHRWEHSQRPILAQVLARYHHIQDLNLLGAVKGLVLIVVRDGVERECKFDSFNEETWRVWVRGADPKRPESISLCDPHHIVKVGA